MWRKKRPLLHITSPTISETSRQGKTCRPTAVRRVGLGVGELRPRLLALAALLRRVHPLLLDVRLDVLAVLQAGRRQRRRRRSPLGGGRRGAVDAQVPRCRQPGGGRRRRVHPAPRRLLARDGGGDAGPAGVYAREGQRPVVVVALSLAAAEALTEVLLVARGYLVLDEADDVREGEGLLADAAGQDILVGVGVCPVCVCCNKSEREKRIMSWERTKLATAAHCNNILNCFSFPPAVFPLSALCRLSGLAFAIN